MQRFIRYNGRVVARAELAKHRDCIYLHRIVVDPEYRGQGIGSALMRRLLREFPRMALAAVPLRAEGSTQSKQALRRWYAHFGFRLVDRKFSLMVRP